MGWRYRRSVKLLPGIRMNMGRSGVTSFSFGGRGVTVNVNKRGTKTTYSLPGTGLSYQSKRSGRHVGKPYVTASMSSKPAPLPRTGMNKTVVAYACVGVVAVLAYGVLQPKSPVLSGTTQATRAGSSTPISLPSTSDLIPSAIAAPASAGHLSRSSEFRLAVTTTGANVRAQPSRTAPVVKVLDKGAAVSLQEGAGEWSRVVDESRRPIGWSHNSILQDRSGR